MLWPPPRKAPPPKPPVEATPAPEPEVKAAEKQEGGYQLWLGLVLAVIFAVIGMNAPSDFVEQFFDLCLVVLYWLAGDQECLCTLCIRH